MSFVIKKSDRAPAITATLGDSSGVVVDLTGTSVKFIMTLAGAAVPKVNAAATIVSATGGQVSYSWGASDTDTAGLYRGEWEVTFAGGVKQTFPPDDFVYVLIEPDLA